MYQRLNVGRSAGLDTRVTWPPDFTSSCGEFEGKEEELRVAAVFKKAGNAILRGVDN
jgi:hypothetical protein